MASSIWEELKKTLKDGVSVAAEKTEEFTKIGRIRVEILNNTRTMEKTYKSLGREVYTQVSDGKKVDPNKDEGIRYFIEKINDFKATIRQKEIEIETIKDDNAGKKKKDIDTEPDPPMDDSPIEKEKAE
ncbi:hypothetical protein KAR48_19065 [bacterium]|nr:hypothetical protein [bacterium]